MASANYQDFEIILERVLWALKLTPEEVMAHVRRHPMDAFHTIPNPKNGSFLIVGAEVTERFRAIAKRYLASNCG